MSSRDAIADLVVRSRRVVTPRGVEDAAVVVERGRIAAVLTRGEPQPEARELLDVGDAVLLPGVVDTHVHINQPGRTDWEGFESATRAATAGGVTTLVDMPLNSVPATTSVAGLRAKQAAAVGLCAVECKFWGGLIPGNQAELEPLAAEGVPGFKCFLAPSGVDEFPPVGERQLRQAMPVIARLGLPLLAHAESSEVLDRTEHTAARGDPRHYASWLGSRPVEAELEAIRLLLSLSRETGCAVHIVHLAAPEALPELSTARAAGVKVTVETCPHYLSFAAEEIEDGDTRFKCRPPIRERARRERLWEGLADGTIDLIASDHSPCPPAMKEIDSGDFFAAWGGIASLELSLAVVWTAARAHGFGLPELARWMSREPARLAGLAARKGAIEPGRDADLVVWDSEAEWVVEGRHLRQRHKLTPYEGRLLTGRVLKTLVGGQPVYDAGEVPGSATRSQL